MTIAIPTRKPKHLTPEQIRSLYDAAMVRYSRGIEAGHLTPNEVRRLVGLPPLYPHERTADGREPDITQPLCGDALAEVPSPCCADARVKVERKTGRR